MFISQGSMKPTCIRVWRAEVWLVFPKTHSHQELQTKGNQEKLQQHVQQQHRLACLQRVSGEIDGWNKWCKNQTPKHRCTKTKFLSLNVLLAIYFPHNEEKPLVVFPVPWPIALKKAVARHGHRESASTFAEEPGRAKPRTNEDRTNGGIDMRLLGGNKTCGGEDLLVQKATLGVLVGNLKV